MVSLRPTRKIQRFAISGLLATLLHVLIAVGFIRFVAPTPPLANGVAFIIATVFSYLVNTLWSFSRPLHKRNFFRFVLVAMAGCLLTVTLSSAAQHYGLHYMYGIGLVILTVTPATFLTHNFWTYK